jgi:hypothetical protein
MPDLDEQIRTVIDAGVPPISADEVIHRESQGASRRPPVRVLTMSMGRTAAVAWAGVIAVAIAALVIGVGFATLSGGTRPQGGGAPPNPNVLITRSFGVGANWVTFTYPSGWEARQYLEDQRGFSQAIVFVASQTLHDPCTTTNSSKVCENYAAGRLDINGVYLEWSYGYDGGAPVHRGRQVTNPGSPIKVGGRAATMDIQRPGTCASIGGDESIAVYVGPGSSGWLMQACLRGPDLERSYSQVLALLNSTHFSSTRVSP